MNYPFSVVYEDNHLLIVNKKNGLLVQGDDTGDKALVDYAKDYIREQSNKPGNIFCGLVHRLDRPVSGLVVLAKTSKALERMNKIFATREVEKTYWAVVKQMPPQQEGTLVHFLLKNTQKNITTAYKTEVTGSQRAELSYKILGEINGLCLLEVKPKTGRPHQIRVQLASMKCPIVGDVKYGYPTLNKDASIHLHARQLEFIHPVLKEVLKVVADVPKDALWNRLEL